MRLVKWKQTSSWPILRWNPWTNPEVFSDICLTPSSPYSPRSLDQREATFRIWKCVIVFRCWSRFDLIFCAFEVRKKRLEARFALSSFFERRIFVQSTRTRNWITLDDTCVFAKRKCAYRGHMEGAPFFNPLTINPSGCFKRPCRKEKGS